MAVISNSSQTLCIINQLEYMVCGNSTILNDFDCPLLSLIKTLYFTTSNSLVCSVSIVHECLDKWKRRTRADTDSDTDTDADSDSDKDTTK